MPANRGSNSSRHSVISDLRRDKVGQVSLLSQWRFSCRRYLQILISTKTDLYISS